MDKYPIKNIIMLICIVILAVLTVPVTGGPLGDYGDASDPNFPSLFASGGPYHLDVSREWIGIASANTTTREEDSIQTDQDKDDAFGWWWTAQNGTNYFTTVVSYDNTVSDPNDPRYLNVLVDVDDSGSWDGGIEWVVQNFSIPFETLPQDVNTIYVAMPVSEILGPDNLVNKWSRITLSEREVTDGSGRWGMFERGETEDFLLKEKPDDVNLPSDEVNFIFIGNPRNPPPLKIKRIVEDVSLKSICNEARWGSCPHGCRGALTPLCPGFSRVYDFKLYVPGTTTWLRLCLESVPNCRCGECSRLSEQSYILSPDKITIADSLGTAPVFGFNLIGPPNINNSGIKLGQFNTFEGYFCFPDRPGHDSVNVTAEVVYDPCDEYIITRVDLPISQIESSATEYAQFYISMETLEDFEFYTDESPNICFETWEDGRDDSGNGSQVGYQEPPYLETQIVHSGRQSMPFSYNNTEGVTESVAYRRFDPPMDWSYYETLGLRIYGDQNNKGGELFVQINDMKTFVEADLSMPSWQNAEIGLQALDVNLADIYCLGIGISGSDSSGLLYIDNIKIHELEFEPQESNRYVIDDFESYTDEPPNQVFKTWLDGLGFDADEFSDGYDGNGSGAIVGHDIWLEGTYMETEIVHYRDQSMPFYYDNISFDNSFATMSWTWSVPESEVFEPNHIELWVHGDPNNTGGTFFVGIDDRKAYPDIDLTMPEWQRAEVYFSTFDPPVIWSENDPINIDWRIGVDGAGSEGIMYIDYFVLYLSE